MQSHICKVHACLAVTCHLHLWQNDRDLLCATAVTRGWNGYWNKSQHRKLTMEKKILPLFLQGFELVTLQSRVRHSNHWAIPAPLRHIYSLLMPCALIIFDKRQGCTKEMGISFVFLGLGDRWWEMKLGWRIGSCCLNTQSALKVKSINQCFIFNSVHSKVILDT